MNLLDYEMPAKLAFLAGLMLWAFWLDRRLSKKEQLRAVITTDRLDRIELALDVHIREHLPKENPADWTMVAFTPLGPDATFPGLRAYEVLAIRKA